MEKRQELSKEVSAKHATKNIHLFSKRLSYESSQANASRPKKSMGGTIQYNTITLFKEGDALVAKLFFLFCFPIDFSISK